MVKKKNKLFCIVIHNFSRSKGDRIIKDLFQKNPIEYLDKEKREEMNKEFEKVNKTKNQRVSNYLGSSAIKEAFNFEGKTAINDKITNSNKERLINTVANNKQMIFKTNGSHVFDGKQGYYR